MFTGSYKIQLKIDAVAFSIAQIIIANHISIGMKNMPLIVNNFFRLWRLIEIFSSTLSHRQYPKHAAIQ